MNEQDSNFSKRLVVLSAMLLLFLILILPVGLTFAIKLIPGGIQPSLGNTIKIYDQIVLSQSFIAPDDNLTGIGTSIKNPNFANKKKATVNLYDDNNKLIRTVILNGQNIADGQFVKILFEPIRDSKNKKFTWSILSFESNFDDALEVFLTTQQPKWSVDFRVNDKLSDGGLSYVTLHKPLTSTEVLTKIVRGWVDKIYADSLFFLCYSTIILSMLGLIIFSKFPPLHWKK